MARGLLTLTLSLALFAPAFAPGPSAEANAATPSGRAGHESRRLETVLELTPAQVAKLEKLRNVKRSAVSPLRRQIKTKRSELRDLWRSSSPDRPRIEAVLNTIDQLRAKVRSAELDFRFDLHAILTPTQRTELTQYLKNSGSLN